QIESKQRSGEVVSHEVLELAAELKYTATQQVSGSRSQVAVVAEVNGAMIELSHVAENIAEMAGQVSASIGNVALSSQHIQETTNRSVSQSYQGRTAVANTINA